MLQLLQQQGRQPFCSLLEQVEGREFPSFLMLKPQEPRVGMETGREAALRCAALRCCSRGGAWPGSSERWVALWWLLRCHTHSAGRDGPTFCHLLPPSRRVQVETLWRFLHARPHLFSVVQHEFLQPAPGSLTVNPPPAAAAAAPAHAILGHRALGSSHCTRRLIAGLSCADLGNMLLLSSSHVCVQAQPPF